jgi:enoyl-CoA hydratase/carnithine racemase
MVNELESQYTAAARDKSVSVVLLRGAGEKAFCAGGDVVTVVNQGQLAKANAREYRFPTDFFRTEYLVDHQIATLSKPHIALIDGITMGGGVGVSVHGRFRVATERSTFAMPETAIGLFPDVGGSWFLPRLPMPGLGFYLALTGAKVQGAALRTAGIATHAMPSARIPELVDELAKFDARVTLTDIGDLLNRFNTLPPADVFKDDVPAKIAQVFGDAVDTPFADTWARLNKLADSGDAWARSTVDTIARMSPTSVRVTYEQLRHGARAPSLGDALTMEYTLVQHALRNDDFYEGVRALLVDGDKKPQWRPRDLASVKDEDIDKWFVPGDGFENLPVPRKLKSAL